MTAKVKEEINWSIVKEALDEGTVSGYKMAVIEAGKILDNILKQKGYPGKDTKDRILNARDNFHNLEGLLNAHKLRKNLTSNLEYQLTSIQVEDAVNAYHQAVIDLTSSEKAKLGIFQKTRMTLRYYLPGKKRLIGFVLSGFFLFLLIVLILADTQFGRDFIQGVVGVTHFIFSWIMIMVLVVIGMGIIVIASLFYFERRNATKIVDEDEEDK
ncbi:hypothetical protein ACFLZS_02075 [Patescibacteria group bacterium]